MLSTTKEAAIARWRRTVWEKRADIDPRNEFDWLALAVGFFLGLQFNIDDARALAGWCVAQRII